jgi:hypothetical protein
MRGQGQIPMSSRERDDAEELRNLLRSADQQSRVKHNVPQPALSSTTASISSSMGGYGRDRPSFLTQERDKQVSELASLLGSIDAGSGPHSTAGAPARPSYSSVSSTTTGVSAAELRDKDLRNIPGSGISGGTTAYRRSTEVRFRILLLLFNNDLLF